MLYLDDLHAGQRFTSGTRLIDEARIKEFAAKFDPQPFHLDETAAQASIFKRSGGEWVAHSSGGDAAACNRWTRPGDFLRVESEIVEITPWRSNPQQGVVTVRSTMLNQNGEVVYLFNADWY